MGRPSGCPNLRAKCALRSNPRRKLLACHFLLPRLWCPWEPSEQSQVKEIGIIETQHLVSKTKRGGRVMARSRAGEEVPFIQSLSLQWVQALASCGVGRWGEVLVWGAELESPGFGS